MKIHTLQHFSLAVIAAAITIVMGLAVTPAMASPVLPNDHVPAIGDANALTESPTFELEDKRLSDMLILSMQAKYPDLARQPGLSISLNRDQVDTETTNAKADSVTVEDLQVDAGRRSYRATMQVWAATQPIGLLAVSGDLSLSNKKAAISNSVSKPSLADKTLAEAKDATKVMTDIPVLTRNIRSGEIISAEDIAVQSINVRGYDQFVTGADQLVGQSARRALVANRPIRPLDIGQPVLITRGQLVTILYQTDNMALTATGKAMENAGINQAITVMNGQSNRTIQAVVSGPNLVTVHGMQPPVLRQSQLSTNTNPVRTSLALPSDGR
jgi:flagella basal body P-ring formation protein FlgA